MGITGYEVRARAREGAWHMRRWSLNGPPKTESVMYSSTTLQTECLASDVNGQVRVLFEDGEWSDWSHPVAPDAPDADVAPDATPSSPVLSPAPAASACGRCRVLGLRRDEWQEYEPQANHILLICPGFNGDANRLRSLGYTVTELYMTEYDKYPPGWNDPQNPDYLNRARFDADGNALPPSGVQDLGTFADDVVLPVIRAAVAAGRGPAAVCTGSRGGQVTLPRLWQAWQGPSVVLNGGCQLAPERMPTNVFLGLVCGGRDFFRTNSPEFTQGAFARWPGPLIHYHHPQDDHGVQTYDHAIGPVLDMVLNSNLSAAAQLHGEAAAAAVWFKPEGTGSGFMQIRST